jgi:outer membrane protein OmpA-like peptidoglycan-associated protein
MELQDCGLIEPAGQAMFLGHAIAVVALGQKKPRATKKERVGAALSRRVQGPPLVVGPS